MNNRLLRRISSLVTLIVAVSFLLVGANRVLPVCEEGADEMFKDFGIEPFSEIDELQLIVDTTFTGVIRKGKKLYSTYDRTQPVVKRACPT